MRTETISNLLEKLDKQQYTDVIRSFSQHNKQIKIPGFSSVDRAPLKLIANTARTSKVFRKALLEEISQVVLHDVEMDLESGISEIKKDIPKSKWLGLAAYLLLLEVDTYTAEAEAIIEDYVIQNQNEEVLLAIDDMARIDKKEEKFREKYLKANKENVELKLALEKNMGLIQKAITETEQLREQKKEFEQKCIEYLAQIDKLSKEKESLLVELEKVNAKVAVAQSMNQSKLDIKVLAPGCEDLLSKYCESISIDFSCATITSMVDTLEKCDEIWVFPDIISYSTYRMLRKWKQGADDRVIVFQTATELVAYAQKLIQDR